jgi:hypothetical protein
MQRHGATRLHAPVVSRSPEKVLVMTMLLGKCNDPGVGPNSLSNPYVVQNVSNNDLCRVSAMGAVCSNTIRASQAIIVQVVVGFVF